MADSTKSAEAASAGRPPVRPSERSRVRALTIAVVILVAAVIILSTVLIAVVTSQSGATETTKFGLTFYQGELPSGTEWSVAIDGVTMSSSSSSIFFAEPNGTYSYFVYPVSGYHLNSSTGTVSVPAASRVYVAFISNITPIGEAFAVGNAKGGYCTGTATTNGCLAGGKWIYNLTIEQSTVKFGSLYFEVVNSSGGVYSAGAGAQFAIVSVTTGTTAAYYTTTAAGFVQSGPFTYESGYNSSRSLPAGLCTIVVAFPTTMATTGLGLGLVAIGQGEYSGTTSPASLP